MSALYGLAVGAMNLRVISLFADLPERTLARVEQLCSMRSYKKGEEVVGDHETTTDVFFILTGTVRVTSFTEAGREVIFNDVSGGGIFGEFSAIDHLPRSARPSGPSPGRCGALPRSGRSTL